MGDHFQFDRDRRGQRGNFDRSPRWIWFASTSKMFGIEFIVDRKILFHVRQEDRDIDDVVPTCARVFENQPDVFKNRTTLLFDVVIRNVAVGVESDPGNFLASPHPLSNAGEEKKIADAFGVWERPHWFGRARTFECLSHVARNCKAVVAAANPKSWQGPRAEWRVTLPPHLAKNEMRNPRFQTVIDHPKCG